MAWDIPLWLGIIMAFGDMAVAFAVGLHYGPHKARKLITGDPEYVATREAIDHTADELLRVRHDLDAHREAVRQELQTALRAQEKTIEGALSRARDVQVTLPPAAVDEAVRGLRSRLKSIIQEELASALERLQPQEQQVTPETATAYADRIMQSNILVGLAQQYPDVPPQIWQLAQRVGLPWLAEYLGIPLEELTGA